MKKILITIENNILYFSYKKNEKINIDLLNTNIISDSEIIFSEDYINENKALVIPFLKELVLINNIDTLTFENINLATYLINLFKNIKIRKIRIKKEEKFTYTLAELITLNKNIKEIECYYIPNFILDYLDNHHIKVKSLSEILYISNFTTENKLDTYSKMFYKRIIKISKTLDNNDITDISTFFKINRYLKEIDLYYFDHKDIEFLLNSLLVYHLKNVIIYICIDIKNEKDILYLKELNKEYKSSKLKVSLKYTDDYIKENLMSQVIINTLKLCGILSLIIITGMIGYVMYNNYTSLQEVTSIQEKVNEAIKENDTSLVEENDNYKIKNNYIASLLTINKDIIGYLKVNNTNINYPVVQAEDNIYYLKKNLNNEDDINGWVYMDYRNSDKILNDNTIIYGHNMYYSGVMFGTLHKVLYSNWYNNEDNLTIEFDTMYESMKWKIFSIYTIPKTSDYLQVSFETPEEKLAYIKMEKNRSIKDFNVEVTENDYLLTLSTCTGDNDRLVVHAKLIQEQQEQPEQSEQPEQQEQEEQLEEEKLNES